MGRHSAGCKREQLDKATKLIFSRSFTASVTDDNVVDVEVVSVYILPERAGKIKKTNKIKIIKQTKKQKELTKTKSQIAIIETQT